MNPKLDERFADTLRNSLVEHVGGRPRRPRMVPAIAVAALAALVISGSIAYADLNPGKLETPLARPIIVTDVGSAVIKLPPAPPGATHLRMILSCMTPGLCETPEGGVSGGSWSSDTGPAMQASYLPLTTAPDPQSAEEPPVLDPAEGLQITAGAHVVWRLYAVYVDEYESPWFTNQSGQTYGVPNNSISGPNLIAVWADDGQLGYTPMAALLGASAQPQFRDEEDVLAYILSPPSPQRLPVYETDGATIVGYLTVR